jgi:hypothetical protein
MQEMSKPERRLGLVEWEEVTGMGEAEQAG